MEVDMKILCAWLAALGVTTSISAGEQPTASAGAAPMMQAFDNLKWSALPERPGMQYSVLSGDPKSGPYTQVRKVPAGTRNPPHSHSADITNVVISGTWYTGTDESSARDFGPGSVILMPGNWVHVSGCRPGSECVFYQDGKGKFDFLPASSKPGT
jgi:quercetin dioxygenase-like cupin family protein